MCDHNSHEHYICLSSASDGVTNTDNTPYAFKTTICPLDLDPMIVWEVALHSVIIPPNFNTIITEEDYIDIYKGRRDADTHRIIDKEHWFRIYAPEERACDSLQEVYNFIDHFFVLGIKKYLGLIKFKAFYPGTDSSYLLKWDATRDKFYMGAGSRANKKALGVLYRDSEEFNPATDNVIFEPSYRIRRMLGFSSNIDLVIYDADKRKPDPHYSDIPPEYGCQLVDAVMVYTDIVEPVRLNNKLVNLLDMFTFTNRLGKTQNEPIYHTLTETRLTDISLMLRDQFGSPLAVKKGNTIATLHIRAK